MRQAKERAEWFKAVWAGEERELPAISLLLKYLQYVGVAWKRFPLCWTLQTEQEQPPPKSLCLSVRQKTNISTKSNRRQIKIPIKNRFALVEPTRKLKINKCK